MAQSDSEVHARACAGRSRSRCIGLEHRKVSAVSYLEYAAITIGGLLTTALVLPALTLLVYDWWKSR